MTLQIPIFYCKSLDPTLGFYEALGFEITYRQAAPYLYAAVTQGEVNIHFSRRAKGALCLVFVPDVTVLHQTFADALRSMGGRVPTAGTPRIARLRTGQTRFHVVDPAGNTLLYVNQYEPESEYDVTAYQSQSALEQALENAVFLRDVYADDRAAARVLDLALARNSTAARLDRARVLAARTELAIALEETARAEELRQELQQIDLTDEEQQHYQAELQAADHLEQWIVYG